MNFRLSSLILLLHIQGSLTVDNFPVNCNEQNICAVEVEHVMLLCSYSNINIKTGFWFSQKQSQNWREKDEPEDLTLDSDYSGRVNQRITNYHSRLTIRDVRERDSGEYQLMFIMKDGVKHISSVTVHLTVTGLQVKMNLIDGQVQLICESSCNLTYKASYYWHKNGQYINNINEESRYMFVLPSGSTDSYSCFVTGKNNPSAYLPCGRGRKCDITLFNQMHSG
ncbi:hypothetical protein IRJ41_019989 [Triplophysa rosa]|uniref:Immunoglobulin domain-containing protein n=1 Tax=Triplophysa rosa TaxID=992332 RepID=A0A9W7WAY8_TRIRA|nr:hypothetical protein IRJ41_019989 [Triplophysa rosa]